MNEMTIGQLKKLIEGCSDSDIVILSCDEEGNGYKELTDVNLSKWDGEDVGLRALTPGLAQQGFCTEDVMAYGQDCVVLYP